MSNVFGLPLHNSENQKHRIKYGERKLLKWLILFAEFSLSILQYNTTIVFGMSIVARIMRLTNKIQRAFYVKTIASGQSGLALSRLYAIPW